MCFRRNGLPVKAIAGAGAALGTGSVMGTTAAGQTIACIVLVELLVSTIGRGRVIGGHRYDPEGERDGLYMVLSVLAIRIPVLAIDGGIGLFCVMIPVLEAMMALSLTLMLRLALVNPGSLSSVRLDPRPILSSVRQEDPTTNAVARGSVIFVVLMGLQGVSWHGTYIEDVLSNLVILTNSIAMGPSVGALGGIAVGILRGLKDPGLIEMVGFYGITGLAAGLVPRPHRRYVSPAVFIASNGILLSYQGWLGNGLPLLCAAGVAGAIQACCPAILYTHWREFWIGEVGKIRSSCANRAISDGNELFPEGREADELRMRLAYMTGAFSNVAHYLAESARPVRSSDLDEDVSLRTVKRCIRVICDLCAKSETCWARHDDGFLRLLARIVRLHSPAGTSLPIELSSRCDKPDEFGIVIKLAREMYLIEGTHQRKTLEGRRVLAQQVINLLAEAASLSATSADESEGLARQGIVRTKSRAVSFSFRVGVAGRPGGEGPISGDTYIVKEIDGKLLLMLSDGMGTGTRASRESRAAAHLIEKLVESGLSQTLAVRILNSLLFVCSGDGTFTTVDFVLADLRSGEVNCVKIGAPPSFLIRGNEVRAIRSPSPPAGILDEIDLKTSRFFLRPADKLVMMTDGLVEPLEGSHATDEWVKSALLNELVSGGTGTYANSSPVQKIAERLIEHAVKRRGKRRGDDMTVLVVEFYRK